jgi:hypothetical protein
MNFKRCAISFAPLTVVLGGLALPAGAQTYNGKFTLPFETLWGAAVLEPGDYTISTNTFGSTPMLHIEGNGKAANIMAATVEIREASLERGRLEITEVNGAHVVTRLNAHAAGREFAFAVPRAVRKGHFEAVALKKVAIPVSNAH